MQHGAILKALLGYNNSNMALKQGGHRTAEMVTNDTKMGWNYNAFIAGVERVRDIGDWEQLQGKKGKGIFAQARLKLGQ